MALTRPTAREERCQKQIAVAQSCLNATLATLFAARKNATGIELVNELDRVDDLLQQANDILFEYVCPF